MSERIERFEVAGTPRLSVRLPAGTVRVVSGPAGQVVVRARGAESDLGRLTITGHGDAVTVEVERTGWGRWASVDLEVEVGAPPEIKARVASSGLKLDAPVREVDLTSASGGLQAGRVEGRLIARLASGDLAVESCGSLDVTSASGNVRVPEVRGEAAVKTASGDVSLGTVGGDLTVRTASGDLTVERLGGSRLEAKTVSGDVRVGVPAGRRYTVSLQSLSGDVRTDFPVSGDGGGAPARLAVTTVSGDVRISGAAGA